MKPTLNLLAGLILLCDVCAGAEPMVRPMADHPGNIYLAGEGVKVDLPEGKESHWELVDYDGARVAEGEAHDGKAELGQLRVGYYELRRRGETARVTIGVLAPLLARTPKTSPIGVDVAMSWFYKPPQMRPVAQLCALAGMNWVRDRLSWGEMEPKKGQFAGRNRYDESAEAQVGRDLRVLQVNHIAPGWAGGEPRRFAPDLRDVYRFYKEMAARWRGKVDAFEPWNEADIEMFGGHSGAEMASLQKAAYFGLKAGNPDVIASLNVFAINRPSTLADLRDNDAVPYFDTCNLHHYIPAEKYPEWYASFRAISGGKPLWVTEFSMPVQWADEKSKEPSDADLKVQAERVAIVFATSLHERPQAAFYFLFPHYVEGKTQFGIVKPDLTPRPAYLALAAAGRLLADAKAIGKTEEGDLRMYFLRAKPDGRESDVVIAWSKGGAKQIRLPARPTAVFDHIGRPIMTEGALTVDKPMYFILPAGSVKEDMPGLKLSPKVPTAERRPACPIVMQSVWPAKRLSVNDSAYRIGATGEQKIPVFIYNFSDQPAKGALKVAGPEAWKMNLPDSVEINPGERKELKLSIDAGGALGKTAQAVRIMGEFAAAGQAVLSLRFVAEPAAAPRASADGMPAPGTHGHYAVLTAGWDVPPPFAAVDIVYGPREGGSIWWQMQFRKENKADGPAMFTLRALTSRDPLGDSASPLRFDRYILKAGDGPALDFRNRHTSLAELPAWKDFERWFIPHAGRGTGRQRGVPETAQLLGHTLTLQWAGENVPWEKWDNEKRLDLDRELLVGTGRNFRDAELHRLPQTPQRQNYKYIPFTREEYPVMIEAGVNLFLVSPEQAGWVRDEPVFYLRQTGGKPPLEYPLDLYRSNYIGPVMFMDEPAIIMVGDKNIHNTLRYFSDAANLLMQRVRSRYQGAAGYSAFDLEKSLRNDHVNLGEMRLEQWDYPAWETIYSTAYYQLAAGLAGIVHEGRYRLDDFDRSMNKWLESPRKHTAEQMLRYHYAFLRGAARQTGKDWGMSIYGQAEAKYSPLAVKLAYDMGARYVWFWTSDHDHHVPWPEQMELSKALKAHAAEHPRKSIRTEARMVDVAVVIPWGYFLELGDLWWVRALDREGKNESSQKYARLMRRAHAEIQKAMDANEDFDIVVDEGKPVSGYRRVVKITDNP